MSKVAERRSTIARPFNAGYARQKGPRAAGTPDPQDTPTNHKREPRPYTIRRIDTLHLDFDNEEMETES